MTASSKEGLQWMLASSKPTRVATTARHPMNLELDWTEKQRQRRAVAEYLTALEADAADKGVAPDDEAGGGSDGKQPRRLSAQAA